MDNNKSILFLRNEINQALLLGSEERVELIGMVDDLKDKLTRLEGINFFEEWKKLFDTIIAEWKKDINKPFFKLDTHLLDKLAFFLDFIAQFFLYNGSEEDNDYLKDVDTFFQQHKLQRGAKDSQALFNKAFKN